MALSRSYLKGMGLTDEQVSAIVEAHAETIEALKAQRDEFEESANKLKDVQKELNELKASKSGDDDWKKKFEAEHKAFNDYKKSLEEKETKEAKVNAYKSLLKDAKVSDKLIDLVVKANAADIDALELDEHGAIKTADDLKKSIATEYADYITDSNTEGAGTDNPPSNAGGTPDEDLGKLSMEDYIKARSK